MESLLIIWPESSFFLLLTWLLPLLLIILQCTSSEVIFSKEDEEQQLNMDEMLWEEDQLENSNSPPEDEKAPNFEVSFAGLDEAGKKRKDKRKHGKKRRPSRSVSMSEDSSGRKNKKRKHKKKKHHGDQQEKDDSDSPEDKHGKKKKKKRKHKKKKKKHKKKKDADIDDDIQKPLGVGMPKNTKFLINSEKGVAKMGKNTTGKYILRISDEYATNILSGSKGSESRGKGKIFLSKSPADLYESVIPEKSAAVIEPKVKPKITYKITNEYMSFYGDTVLSKKPLPKAPAPTANNLSNSSSASN